MASYYEQLSSPRILAAAWGRLNKSNKHSHGLDQETIEKFRARLQKNISVISQELRKKTYRFCPLRAKPIPKEGGGSRLLRIPAVRDRIVFSALKSLIEPKFQRFNLPCSHGYVHGRSPRTAIDHVTKLASAGGTFVLEADIKKFFDTVNREDLIAKFTKEVRVPSIRALIEKAIRAEVGNLEEFGPSDRVFLMQDSGIPQGGVLSPMLANFYLYPFDFEMTRGGFGLVRYADDFVVICSSRDEAQRAYELSRHILEDQLGLTMHRLHDPKSKTRIIRFSEGFTFLGVEFHSGKIYPSSKSVQRFRNRVREILDPRGTATLLQTLLTLKRTVEGWGAAYRDFDSTETFVALDNEIRGLTTQYFRGRSFLSRQFNLGTKEMRHLGVPSLQWIKKSQHVDLPRARPGTWNDQAKHGLRAAPNSPSTAPVRC